MSRPKDTEPLQAHVEYYGQQGYRVQSQTQATAQLVRPKRFSRVWALVWFFLVAGIIGLAGYLFYHYYVVNKEETVYLSVSDGKVSVRRDKLDFDMLFWAFAVGFCGIWLIVSAASGNRFLLLGAVIYGGLLALVTAAKMLARQEDGADGRTEV